jgi:hypothetical protein
VIQAARSHGDDHFLGAGGGIGNFAQFKLAGSSRRDQLYDFHNDECSGAMGWRGNLFQRFAPHLERGALLRRNRVATRWGEAPDEPPQADSLAPLKPGEGRGEGI